MPKYDNSSLQMSVSKWIHTQVLQCPCCVRFCRLLCLNSKQEDIKAKSLKYFPDWLSLWVSPHPSFVRSQAHICSVLNSLWTVLTLAAVGSHTKLTPFQKTRASYSVLWNWISLAIQSRQEEKRKEGELSHKQPYAPVKMQNFCSFPRFK